MTVEEIDSGLVYHEKGVHIRRIKEKSLEQVINFSCSIAVTHGNLYSSEGRRGNSPLSSFTLVTILALI